MTREEKLAVAKIVHSEIVDVLTKYEYAECLNIRMHWNGISVGGELFDPDELERPTTTYFPA